MKLKKIIKVSPKCQEDEPDIAQNVFVIISLNLWWPISVPRFTEFTDGHVVLYDSALYPMYQTQRWKESFYFRTQTSNTAVESLWCTRDNQNQCCGLSFQARKQFIYGQNRSCNVYLWVSVFRKIIWNLFLVDGRMQNSSKDTECLPSRKTSTEKIWRRLVKTY